MNHTRDCTFIDAKWRGNLSPAPQNNILVFHKKRVYRRAWHCPCEITSLHSEYQCLFTFFPKADRIVRWVLSESQNPSPISWSCSFQKQDGGKKEIKEIPHGKNGVLCSRNASIVTISVKWRQCSPGHISLNSISFLIISSLCLHLSPSSLCIAGVTPDACVDTLGF